ncbi:hypothetical protein [Thaumasiovibrio subtropicus]|uniref:hypothetical protein n=1 Tax=Thaumasiovibrio subtropicus TaxID=1891207 RepID=UPI000B35CF50|nr:hypothetical protein [Thaumasiovibrio subtropicus]
MYANYLLDAYKQAKNYVQDKQIAHDLNISPQKMTEIRKGRRYLTETEALFLAKNAEIDSEQALLGLAADKSKNYEAKQIIEGIMEKLKATRISRYAHVITGITVLGVTTSQCALCMLC